MNNQSPYILGISAYYHDSAACLLQDGKIIAAASEERFTRKKHDEDFPENAIKYCLQEAGITVGQIDYIVFYEKPLIKFERLLTTYIRNWPRGIVSFVKSMRTWLGKKLWTRNNIVKAMEKIAGYKKCLQNEILFVPHHLSHAASTFYTSPYEKAAVLTIDGVGEYSTASIGHGSGTDLLIDQDLNFPNSLGLFYSALTYFLGFKVNSAEYKVMGLAPYGEAKYVDQLKQLIKIFDDGSIELNMKYFSYEYGLTMTSKKLEKLLGRKRRKEKDKLEQYHMDMAASLQKITEEIVLKMADYAWQKYQLPNLCLAGGVALNCVANGRILKESKFKNIYVFPAAGDAGGAVGAAYYLYHHILKKSPRQSLESIYLGPGYSREEIKKLLDEHQIPHQELPEKSNSNQLSIFEKIAELIDQNKVIGLFQGRMEFGPRALGNRSIIGDPRRQENWQRVNLKIKFRESFRPFAPTVLEEELSKIYELETPSPYMLLTANAKVKNLPATTHVDGSARIQSVNAVQNPRYHQIIKSFYQKTGCPVIINTSFNVRGEPIILSPEDALKCFIRTDIDILVLENFLISADQINKDQLKQKFPLEQFEDD